MKLTLVKLGDHHMAYYGSVRGLAKLLRELDKCEPLLAYSNADGTGEKYMRLTNRTLDIDFIKEEDIDEKYIRVITGY